MSPFVAGILRIAVLQTSCALLVVKRVTVKSTGTYARKLKVLFVGLAAVSVFSFANFGDLRGSEGIVNHWEQYHFYFGSKYLKGARATSSRACYSFSSSRGPRLILHGDTTEIVHGKPKRLLTSFLLRLDLENTGTAAVTLQRPTIDARVALPVSRWYVGGGDGQPWDGVLKAGETKLVHVIGYAGEPVEPETELDATIHLESLTLPTKVRARSRWNQTE